MVRLPMLIGLFVALVVTVLAAVFGPWGWWIVALVVAMLLAVAIHDATQRKHSILRNYPVIGHARFFLEEIRPEMQQYFIERNWDGKPFNRDQRSLVYSRAKGFKGDKAFGSELNMNEPGYEYFVHSIAPKQVPDEAMRVRLGGPDCRQPYDISVFNVSAMSFGSLSQNAVLAMNKGAAMGGFAQDTGEGGLSKYHLAYGADLLWEFGSGYFGCRDAEGNFDPETFRHKAALEQVKAVTIKLSQGAKPGLGGVLPGPKVTAEIAEARGVPEGQTCISPASHSAFGTPRELVAFIARLRELAGGKPIGFKLCVGSRVEFLAICKAMLEADCTPDYIIVDGAEGGTGAAPSEYQDRVGSPLTEGLILVHNALVGAGLRDRIKLGAAGKVTSGFDIVRHLIQGADFCLSARAMMMAVGCIQAQRCHTNTCPVGVATQNPRLYRALDVEDKGERVYNYHRLTVEEAVQIVSTMGVEHPEQLTRKMVRRRISATSSRSYDSLYDWLEPDALLNGAPGDWGQDWNRADPEVFVSGLAEHTVYEDRAPEAYDDDPDNDTFGTAYALRHPGDERAMQRRGVPVAEASGGGSGRPEGRPGSAAGAQHTVADPSEQSNHVDPDDE